jgi:hypothetical protein
LGAEALRRKLSKEFSYYHPENELEFIVSHPKLCTEMFGKEISPDWRRPQIPATNIGAVAELMADLPNKSFLLQSRKTTPQRTARHPKSHCRPFIRSYICPKG